MIDYHFNQSKNYLEVKIEGAIHLPEIIELAKNILSCKSYPRELKILDDERNVDYLFDPDDLNEVLDIVLENIDKFTSVKHAILIDSPRGAAYIYLFSEMALKIKKYKLCVFTTPDRAINWLLHKPDLPRVIKKHRGVLNNNDY